MKPGVTEKQIVNWKNNLPAAFKTKVYSGNLQVDFELSERHIFLV